MKHIAVILFVALLCGAMLFIHDSHAEAVHLFINQDGSINLAAGEYPYVPKAGDVIRCEDGSNYTITSIDGYEAPVLPGDDYDQAELPEAEVIHFVDVSGDYLFLRNLHETARMAATLSGTLGISADFIQSWIPENAVPDVTHTWDAGRAAAMPGKGRYGVEAWDAFKDGVFLWTAYEVSPSCSRTWSLWKTAFMKRRAGRSAISAPTTMDAAGGTRPGPATRSWPWRRSKRRSTVFMRH